MISSKEYSQLTSLRSNPNAIDNNIYAIETFGKEGLIDYRFVSLTTYDGFIVTLKGERAIEEYESFLKTKEREEETLTIAREANELAKEANTISEQSNLTAKYSKNLSIIAIIVSIISALATIAGVIISACLTL